MEHITAMVQLYPWFSYYFTLYVCLAMYDNGYKPKENKRNKVKIEPEFNTSQRSRFLSTVDIVSGVYARVD